jgi:peptidoglycan/xylan/chitin deacetylase (PgdA/CDA1 family)
VWHGIISTVGRREFRLPDVGPLVSFSFDDFPRSALHVGGAILKSYGISGTYYAAMGLMGTANGMGPQFRTEDLERLLKDGHELGSHTFGHRSCRALPLRDFEAEVIKGKEAVERITGPGRSHHFSYPYGHVTLRAKGRVGARLASCRGIFPGINTSPVDLNLLRANNLYSWSFDLDAIGRLLTQNGKQRGWLIFYTHDISDQPSAFGCTPSQFESVVKLVTRAGGTALPVGKVAGSTTSTPAAHKMKHSFNSQQDLDISGPNSFYSAKVGKTGGVDVCG